MKLDTKKRLAARTLKVGLGRIEFNIDRLDEIKEAITKQDIKDLKESGAIKIKEIKGRKTVVGRKRKRGPGKIKKTVNVRKRTYMIMTRKLRKYVEGVKKQGTLNRDEGKDIRKKIRNRLFRSKAHLKDYIGGLKRWK